MLFARQGEEKFKLVDQNRAPSQWLSPCRNQAPPCEMPLQLMENPVVSQYF
jgi:hypothetical protein